LSLAPCDIFSRQSLWISPDKYILKLIKFYSVTGGYYRTIGADSDQLIQTIIPLNLL